MSTMTKTMQRFVIGGIVVTAVFILYAGFYLYLRTNGTLTHYYNTGDGHQILRSREYGQMEQFMIAVMNSPTAARDATIQTTKYLDFIEAIFYPLRLVESHVHVDPVLPQ